MTPNLPNLWPPGRRGDDLLPTPAWPVYTLTKA